MGALRRRHGPQVAILTPALCAFLTALAQTLGAFGAALLRRQRRAVRRLRRLLRRACLDALFGPFLAGVANVLAALRALGRRQPAQFAVFPGALRALLHALLRGIDLPRRGWRLPVW
ncbi:MAG: hypothetical protein AB7T86_10255 [Xanthobacteraceae bacterium]